MKTKILVKTSFTILLCLPILLFSQIKFAWITDTHIGSPNSSEDLSEIVHDVNQSDVKFVILTGDITEKGKNSELMEAKSILSGLNKPYFIIPGNHDTKWSESGCVKFKELFGDNRFYFVYDDYVFIGLNSGIPLRGGGGHISIEDLQWLDAKLNRLSNNSKIILAVHHQLDNEIDNWFEITNRLKKFSKAFVLVGHGHSNRAYDFNGINGAMGRSSLRKHKTAGYNIVTLQNDSIFIEETNLTQKNHWYQNSIEIKHKTLFKVHNIHKNYRTKKFEIKKIFQTKSTLVKTGLIHKNFLVFADLSGNVYSTNISGKLIWNRKFNTSFFGNPINYKNQLILCGTDGIVYFININNGKLIRKINLNSPIIASPTLTAKKNSLIIFSNDGYANYIDIKSHEVNRKKIANLNFEAIPLYHDNRIVIGSWDNYLYSISDSYSDTLIYLWRWTENKNFYYSPAACSPIIDQQKRILISTPDKFISAIDFDNGKTLWRSNEYNSWESIGINKRKDILFIKSIIDTIFALNIKDSIPNLIWKNGLDYGLDTNPINLVEHQNNLFIPSKNGSLYVLNSENGKLLLKIKLGNSRLNNIIPVSKNVLLISNMDGEIFKIILR